MNEQTATVESKVDLQEGKVLIKIGPLHLYASLP